MTLIRFCISERRIKCLERNEIRRTLWRKRSISLSLTYDSEVFGFPVESLRTIVPVSSRSGSNYGFVAAHWPPRRYRANRVPLSHANSPATAVIASRRGLTSNTSWLVFSRTVGVSPLSHSPRTRRSFSRHTSLAVLSRASLSTFSLLP